MFMFSGIVGGEKHNHQGGGVNYLCLPHNPKYDRYKDGYQNTGRVLGTEYEVSGFNPFKKNLQDHEAPCAVCFVKSRGAMLMMPARNDCPSGWTEEYHGYLMTEHWNSPKQTDFICVDPGGGGGVLPEKFGRGVRPASQKPYPIYDQNLRYSLPYL